MTQHEEGLCQLADTFPSPAIVSIRPADHDLMITGRREERGDCQARAGTSRLRVERASEREREREKKGGRLTGDTNPKIMVIFPPLSRREMFWYYAFYVRKQGCEPLHWALSVWFLGN